MEDHKETYFSIDSRLLFQLGEKLVADRAVALAELVKNSYDADATHGIVGMQQVKARGGTIVVEDNGTGITPAMFDQTWMRIATIDKELNPISSKYSRQKAGEKGIGRFACRRLSEILEFGIYRGSRMKGLGQYIDAVHSRLAPFKHWFLQAIGVDPQFQGRGYASKLLRPMLSRIDEEGLPCYLETLEEQNVRLYEHFGFKVIEESKVPNTNLTNWAMLRDAR